MFGFNDYFDKKKVNKGYKDCSCEIRDYMLLLDMLLEHYIDAKTNSSEGLIFSRGMKMTETEIEAYFFKAPSERVSTGYDEDFAGQVRQAFVYIESRIDHTPDEVRLPIRDCAARLELDRDEIFVLILALSMQIDMKYTRLYGYISGEPSMQYPTVGVYQALYETFDPAGAAGAVAKISDTDGRLIRLCMDMSVILEKKRPHLHTPLVIRGEVLKVLTASEAEHNRTDSYADGVRGEYTSGTAGNEALSCEDIVLGVLPESYNRLAENISRIEKNIRGENGFLKPRGSEAESAYYYIECEDPGDVRAIMASLPGKYVTVDADSILAEKEDEPYALLQPYITRLALGGGRPLIRCKDDKYLKKISSVFSDFTPVYIYGAKEMPKDLLHAKDGFMATPIEVSLPDVRERLSIWK
ncbi:MAG: hypothetical protein J6N76_06735, partial [Lachnospiraceae bacterium]|nr:hypothetical protein [Lachnospiraceae bacterium]